ncbi:MAG TPA: nitroreductase family protein [Bacillota bacterium]|nr:nitroreductase family protein [Bacillota bacterium]
MIYQEFKDIILSRRSIRNFTDQEVMIEDIEEIIDCARFAPSDTNSQSWEFIVIKNQEMIKHIEKLTWDALYEKAAIAEKKGKEKEAKLLIRSFGPYATAFANAPVLIICLATPYQSKFREKIFEPVEFVPESVWEEEGIKSSCMATQNLMLAAHVRGLGTCAMTGPIMLAKEQMREYLNIGADRQFNLVVALGYPKDSPKKLPRKEIKEITQFFL